MTWLLLDGSQPRIRAVGLHGYLPQVPWMRDAFGGPPVWGECQGGQAMAKPHDTQDHKMFQEHPMVKELLAELQEIDDKARVEVQFYEIIA
jgi:hypothetical protein